MNGRRSGVKIPHHWCMPGAETFGPRTDEGFDEVARQLKDYLAGGRREFDLPLQARGSVPQRRVWDLVAEVPYGQTITYGSLARRLNCDVTPQQVGADISRNPLCILIPCHRVVGSNGQLTGYAGGLERKRALSELEQLTLGAGGARSAGHRRRVAGGSSARQY
jgi:methylated-DNA-[protein]-cysteine S-methyltransferase